MRRLCDEEKNLVASVSVKCAASANIDAEPVTNAAAVFAPASSPLATRARKDGQSTVVVDASNALAGFQLLGQSTGRPPVTATLAPDT